ncbi:hypothetical protein [Streptomyces sp. CYG20]|uniref:hypothetical protein n=1 Tax=Streptomyces sp. CYG20 TaxID=2838873 RepID=UPI002036C892|nr:hypothetical protein [Streptomyces sp. CYG20]
MGDHAGPGGLVLPEGLRDAALDRGERRFGQVREAPSGDVCPLGEDAADGVGDAVEDAAFREPPELAQRLPAHGGLVDGVEPGPLIRVPHRLGDVHALTAAHRHQLVVALPPRRLAGQDPAAGEAAGKGHLLQRLDARDLRRGLLPDLDDALVVDRLDPELHRGLDQALQPLPDLPQPLLQGLEGAGQLVRETVEAGTDQRPRRRRHLLHVVPQARPRARDLLLHRREEQAHLVPQIGEPLQGPADETRDAALAPEEVTVEPLERLGYALGQPRDRVDRGLELLPQLRQVLDQAHHRRDDEPDEHLHRQLGHQRRQGDQRRHQRQQRREEFHQHLRGQQQQLRQERGQGDEDLPDGVGQLDERRDQHGQDRHQLLEEVQELGGVLGGQLADDGGQALDDRGEDRAEL